MLKVAGLALFLHNLGLKSTIILSLLESVAYLTLTLQCYCNVILTNHFGDYRVVEWKLFQSHFLKVLFALLCAQLFN